MEKQNTESLRIACTGCSLADFVYAKVDFASEAFKRCQSKTDGDGGLNPGHLVFAEDLERFADKPFLQLCDELTNGAKPDTFNLGGPAIVALINAAQITQSKNARFDFYGAHGRDETAEKILDILRQTPVNFEHYRQLNGPTPFTDVLSDPDHNDGQGERTFINSIGAAWNYTPEHLGDDFFASDVVFYGGTALTPGIHDNLTRLLKQGRERGCVNIVATVFDFRNEKLGNGGKWPLGESDESYRFIDLLIVDWVEAMRLSGTNTLDAAARFFIVGGVKSFIITHGADDFYIWSNGTFFKRRELSALPVSALVGERLMAQPELKGDTTGCGDNFAGGVLASVAEQLGRTWPGNLDMIEACSWGCASGGFACFYVGGTYLEQKPGEKREKVAEFQQAYMHQLSSLDKKSKR